MDLMFISFLANYWALTGPTCFYGAMTLLKIQGLQIPTRGPNRGARTDPRLFLSLFVCIGMVP